MRIFPEKKQSSGNDLKCPGCGATMTIDFAAGKAICPYCRTIVPVEGSPENVKSILSFVDRRLDKMAEEKRERELRRKQQRRQSLMICIVGLIVVGILLSIMISKERREQAIAQEQGITVITETSTQPPEVVSQDNSTAKEVTAAKVTPKKATAQDLIDAEGGIVAYVSDNSYLIINTNTKTITMINSVSSQEIPYTTGDCYFINFIARLNSRHYKIL